MVATGAFLAGLAVAAGAFGAHGLRGRLTPDMLQVWETAARYHMYHALALIATGIIADRWPAPLLDKTGWLFLAGIVLFSGSLYALATTGITTLGAITPIGGLAFLLGWACLAAAAL